MELLTFALLLLVLLCVLLGMGLWISLSLAAVGWVAMSVASPTPGLFLAGAMWEATGSWTLAALPMFIWMGEILFRTRLSQDMFRGLAPWMQRLPGRLLHTIRFSGARHTLNTSGWAAGTYFVRLQSGAAVATQRLLVTQ